MHSLIVLTKTRMAVAMTGAVLAIAMMATSAQAAGPSIVPGRSSAPAGGTSDIGFGVGSGNVNSQLGERIPSTIKAVWSKRFVTCTQGDFSAVKSIAIVGSRLFLTSYNYACGTVFGLTTDGKLNWGNQPNTFVGRLKVANGLVYLPHLVQATTRDGHGTVPVAAFAVDKDVPDGVRLWTSEAVDEEAGSDYGVNEEYVTSVAGGLISSGTAISDAVTGKYLFDLPLESTAARGVRWTAEHDGVRGGTSFVTPSQIIYNSNTDVEAFNHQGEHLWTYLKTGGVKGAGYGHAEPSLTRGRLYIPSTAAVGAGKTLVLNAASGALERTLPGTSQPLAIDGRVGIFTTPARSSKAATLSAVDTVTGSVYWTHTVARLDRHPGAVASGPVIENGLIWYQSGNSFASPGTLVSISEKTGKTKTTTQQRCPPSGSNIAIAQGLIATGTECGIVAYRGN